MTPEEQKIREHETILSEATIMRIAINRNVGNKLGGCGCEDATIRGTVTGRPTYPVIQPTMR